MVQSLWSKRFLDNWWVTCEWPYFDRVRSKESLVIELIDHAMHLYLWVLGLLENRLICEIWDKESIFSLLESQRGGMAKDSEYNFKFSLFIQF